MMIPAIFLLSFSSLAFEIILVRIFAISQWNHLSFMVISIALFGFASGGICLCVLSVHLKDWEQKLSGTTELKIIILLFSITSLLSFLGIRNIPLDYFKIMSEPVQFLYLFLVYLMPAIPFFFTGLVISLGFSAMPEKTGIVYFSTMAGSSAGALVPLLFLPYTGEGRLILIVSVIPVLMIVYNYFFSLEVTPYAREKKLSIIITIAGVAILIGSFYLIFSNHGSSAVIRTSQYKYFSTLMQFPGSEIMESSTGIKGKINRVKSPYIRYAPGLSLKFTGDMPKQEVLLVDGDRSTVIYPGETEKVSEFARYTLSFAGYLFLENPDDILLLLNGGGISPLNALSSGAAHITLIEKYPEIARYLKNIYNLNAITDNPRAFLKNTEDHYDLITLENPGYSLPGVSGMSQEYLLTKETIVDLLLHLKKEGVLVISRKLLLPPSDSIRMWNTVYISLRETGYASPENHMAMIRNWDTYCLIVTVIPMGSVKKLMDFTGDMNFDIVHVPGMQPEYANRYNVFERAYYAETIHELSVALEKGTDHDFIRNYSVNIDAPSDIHPYFGSFLKWSKFKTLYSSLGNRSFFLMLSGEIVIVYIFFESLIIAVLLLLLPVLFLRKKGKLPDLSKFIYFISLGAGFVLTELYFIKTWTLLLGDPVISLTVVLIGLLFFSGIGGFLSGNMSHKQSRSALAGLVLILLLYLCFLPDLVQFMLHLSKWERYVSAFFMMVPPGILLGIPFSTGMRFLLDTPVKKAYGWSANGCSSVIASILAEQIAISFGISFMVLSAAMMYSVTLFVFDT